MTILPLIITVLLLIIVIAPLPFMSPENRLSHFLLGSILAILIGILTRLLILSILSIKTQYTKDMREIFLDAERAISEISRHDKDSENS